MRIITRVCALITLGAVVAACGPQNPSTVDTASEADSSVGCPDRPRPPAPETGPSHGDYFPPYTSLDDLTGASELVVLGEVTKLGRGEISSAQPGHGGFQSLTVTLKVMEVYRGESEAEAIVYNESGWSLGPPEQPYEQETTEADVHRAQVGDCGFYFLTRSGAGEDSAFHLTSIQGKFIAEDQNGLFAGYERSDPFTAEMAAMSFTEFRDAVRAASERTEGTPPRDVECSQAGPRPVHCGPG